MEILHSEINNQLIIFEPYVTVAENIRSCVHEVVYRVKSKMHTSPSLLSMRILAKISEVRRLLLDS